ncbi:hypothetical protein Pint_22307 [Pistacia integerrima]|uniref:Uncharacterized protein n=1 Tax=Pistacia integerrima TaxID=434235 RepID=A0ACC0YI26_9ROSI|nr:hypothetical protein Pint_22307 [Pistacia integerrima]
MIEDIDDENFKTTFKIVEGQLLKYKNFHYYVQATPKGDGSLVHWTYNYEKANEDVPEPNGVLQLAIDVTIDINAHLSKNPENQSSYIIQNQVMPS